MKAVKVVMDPAVLAFPPEMSSHEMLDRVPFLASWARLVRTRELEVHIAPEIREFLIRNNFFPAHETVSAAIEALGLRFRYAPQDVIGPVTTILNRALTSLYCCVKDEVHEEFASTPPQPWHKNPDLNYQSQRSILLARIEQLLHGAPPRLAFATRAVTGEVSFSAIISLVDPDGLWGFTLADLPKRVEGSVAAVSSFEDILDCSSSSAHWAAATDNFGIKIAIQIRCREKLKATRNYESFEKLPTFYVGSDFYPSLLACQASGSGRFASTTLEACASGALGLETLEWNPFEKPQRTADNAMPLRAHITKSGPALRLMAWKRKTTAGEQCLEFANVGVKWEEEITSTDPAEAV